MGRKGGSYEIDKKTGKKMKVAETKAPKTETKKIKPTK